MNSNSSSPQDDTTGGVGNNNGRRKGYQTGFNLNSHHLSSDMIPPSATYFENRPSSSVHGSLSIEEAEALQAQRYQDWLDEYSNNSAQQQHNFTFVSNPWQQQPQPQPQPQQQQQPTSYYDAWVFQDQYADRSAATTVPESSGTNNVMPPTPPRTSASPSNNQLPKTTGKSPAKRKRAPPKPAAASEKRARPRQDSEEDSDDDDNDWLFEGGISVGTGGVTGANGSRKSIGRL